MENGGLLIRVDQCPCVKKKGGSGGGVSSYVLLTPERDGLANSPLQFISSSCIYLPLVLFWICINWGLGKGAVQKPRNALKKSVLNGEFEAFSKIK